MEGLRAVCSYKGWDYKGTLLNGRDRQNHQEIHRGELRPKSAYIRDDNMRTLLYMELCFRGNILHLLRGSWKLSFKITGKGMCISL